MSEALRLGERVGDMILEHFKRLEDPEYRAEMARRQEADRARKTEQIRAYMQDVARRAVGKPISITLTKATRTRSGSGIAGTITKAEFMVRQLPYGVEGCLRVWVDGQGPHTLSRWPRW